MRKTETQKTTTDPKRKTTMMKGDTIIINGKQAIVVDTNWTTIHYKYERFGAVFSISHSAFKAQ